MTSIEQIQISGVRSFDPNPSHRQSIVFQKPLTVILGKNGAGKTTIIEALLNACTGQMPPGIGTEKSSFVYDPKVMGETDVKAQIRLMFTGRGGKVMQVIRSFQAVRTRTKTSFSTLDSTVAFQDTATGKVVSSTYRTNDVDRAVPEMLGVSPAVLEHVIFCHQEDGNWPLSAPKDVKKIFDDIFAATRYVQALDRLRENSKELRKQQKDHEVTLMSLREHREQAEHLRSDIAAKEELVRTIQERAKSTEPVLKELHAVAAALSAVERNAEDLTREAAIIQGRIEEKTQSLSRMNLPPTTLGLEEMLAFKETFPEHMKTLEKDISEKESFLEKAEANKLQCEEISLKLRSTINSLEYQEQQYKQNCTLLDEIAKNASTGFVLGDNDKSMEGLQRLSEHFNGELQKAKLEHDKLLQSIDDKMKLLEDQRVTMLRLMDADEKEKEMKEEQLKHLYERIIDTEESLVKLRPHVRPTQLESLKKTISELEQRVEAMEELKKNGDKYKQRQRILEEVEAKNRVVAKLRQELAKHKERLGGEAEMNFLRTQIAEKEISLNEEIRKSLVPELSKFGHAVSEDNCSLAQLSLLVEHLRDQKRSSFRQIETERSELDRQLVVLEQKRAQGMEELMRENAELQRKSSICENILGGLKEVDHFEVLLEEARESLHKARNKRHALEAMANCYANFVEVAKAECKCPVCDRDFEDDTALNNFVDLNQRYHESSPENLQMAQIEAAEAEQKVRRLESIEANVHNVRRLASGVPELKKRISLINEELANKSALLEDLERKKEGVETQIMYVEDLVRIVIDLNALASDIRTMKQQLSRREASLKEMNAEHATSVLGAGIDGGGGGARTYEDINAEYEAADAELYRLNLLLSEAQRREDDESDQALISELNTRQAEYCQLEMKMMRQGELEEVLARYRSEASGYKERIHVIDTEKSKLEGEIRHIQSNINHLQKEHQETESSTQRGQMRKLEESIRVLNDILPKMQNFFSVQYGEQLARAREQQNSAHASSVAAAEEVKRLRESILESRRVMDKDQRRMTEVEKYIEVFEKRKGITEDEARLAEVERSLGELKSREIHGVESILGKDVILRESVPRIREVIREKMSQLEQSRAQQSGNVETMLQDIEKLKKQLECEKYKDIEKRYRSTFLKVQTTEIAVADIDKYYRALEKAVQSYHQEKIAQINQILADLWRQTYKGSDIDTVELRSEDDATSTTARRSYSYRVVMKRGNSEMDMRGRCSAGQKVLASVLIRLALSEAFCCHCGILALDEPTTNLDEDNARSLAESLSLLIDNHRAVKHFQLIVITHDEQFVRALGGQALDTFYYIHKDREGAFSVIEERTFDQLFAA